MSLSSHNSSPVIVPVNVKPRPVPIQLPAGSFDHCITRTQSNLLPEPYRGKVRDVYTLDDKRLLIVASDRISAFDHILRQAIPYKGQILNQVAAFFFEEVKDLTPVHLLEVPHPNISIVRRCQALPIEVVMRGCLAGHAWREYSAGKRTLCGVSLPEGLRESEHFPNPILTPATKATEGHDEDISEIEILNRGIIDPDIWEKVRSTAFQLFKRGQEIALSRGLILVDTKYEFGLDGDEIVLIDEVHTPDSSRYYYLDGYEERLASGERQKQLSKEFIREWLMSEGFQGLEGQVLPDMDEPFRQSVTERYAELFHLVTGREFVPLPTPDFNTTLDHIIERVR
jgi:phosphoribosylaminoimidazole-succinocarboxamide synthase